MSVIRVNDVHKKFRVYYDKGSTLKEKTLFKSRNRYEDRWVLRGISFELEKGEAIGLVGENGCGKSTMLKMLTRIMYPDQGTIEVNGRVSSLIELGAGFHPDMTGRENIYTNAAIFGLTRKEIDERLDDIIAFSELGEYIDNPVRTYSSGMYMRLAFSVAINVDADVLYRPFQTLSNGEQTKVMLAVLFSKENNFLLIDEPTNHLDMETRILVKEYLNKKKGFILVSHDRSFLDGCIDHVLSINKCNIEVMKGNFSKRLLDLSTK